MRMRKRIIINKHVIKLNQISDITHDFQQIEERKGKKGGGRDNKKTKGTNDAIIGLVELQSSPTNLILYINVSIGCQQHFYCFSVTMARSNVKGSGSVLKKKGENKIRMRIRIIINKNMMKLNQISNITYTSSNK